MTVNFMGLMDNELKRLSQDKKSFKNFGHKQFSLVTSEHSGLQHIIYCFGNMLKPTVRLGQLTALKLRT